MTHTKRNVMLIVATVLLLGCLLAATLVGANAYAEITEKSFVHLSGLSKGNTRVNTVDGTDISAISASGVYLTMGNNDVSYDHANGWDTPQLKPSSSSKVVTLNGVQLSDARLTKYDANSYYLSLGQDATAGSILVLDGVFYHDADDNNSYDSSTEQGVNVSAAMFVYDGDVWSEVRPTFTIKHNGVATDNLCVTVGENKSVVTATASVSGGVLSAVTNGVTVSVPSAAVTNSKFKLVSGQTTSAYTLTVSAKFKYTANGTAYYVTFEEYVDFTVAYHSFAMKNGAKLALFEKGGLTFGASISNDDYNSLSGYTFKCALLPRSDFNTLFEANGMTRSLVTSSAATIVECTATQTDSGYLLMGEFCPIDSANFTTEYVGVVYAQKNNTCYFANFADDNVENNTRSCYYLAQLCVDTNDNAQKAQEVYITPQGEKTANLVVKTVVLGRGQPVETTSTYTKVVNTTETVDAPEVDDATLVSASQVQQKIYLNRNNEVTFTYVDKATSAVGVSTWFLPYLSEENCYQNDYNYKIVSEMKAAGLNTVLLNGAFSGNVTSVDDVERMRQLIALFNDYGISSFVDLKKQYFALGEYPDFSDCEGFLGISQWDEPYAEMIENILPQYAKAFDDLYGDSAEFWCNLFPSEAAGNTEAFGQLNGSKLTDYATYLQLYCEKVLSQITKGTKILSVDSYPIYADYSLDSNFLTSIGLLKYYAKEYGAKANICLQSCGWNEGNTLKARMPSEAEMRLQVYAALAFGMDSISWFTYSQYQSADIQTSDMAPVEYLTGATNSGYTALKTVNNELLALADVYAGFDWQGTLFDFGTNSGEKSGYTTLNNTAFSKYVLSASDTQFSSISAKNSSIVSSHSLLTGVFNSKTNSNMKGYAFCNYDSCKNGGTTVTVTLKSSTPLTATICRNGTSTVVTIDSSGYTLSLDGGEGCFMTCTPS